MEKKPNGVKIVLVCILVVLVVAICISLIYLAFFQGGIGRPEPAAPAPAVTGSPSPLPSAGANGGTQKEASSGLPSAQASPKPAASPSSPESLTAQPDSYEEFAESTKQYRGYRIALVSGGLDSYNFGGIESVELDKDGTAILHCTAGLGEVYGLEYEVETGVLVAYACPYGNGDWGAVFFLLEDGTVEALSPSAIIDEDKIVKLRELGGLKNVVSIGRMEEGEHAGLICASDLEGNVTVLDPYLSE